MSALGLDWWPELPPLTGVQMLVDIDDPIGIEEHPPVTADSSVTTTLNVDDYVLGELSFVMVWNCPDGSSVPDIDLHVTTPAPENCHIWYNDTTPSCTQGSLDRDDITGVGSNGGPERIYWPDASIPPSGTYTYGLDFYSWTAGECANPAYEIGVYNGTTRIKTHVGTLTNNSTSNDPDEFSATVVY